MASRARTDLRGSMSTLIRTFSQNRFTLISWGVTGLIVAALLGSALWWTHQSAGSLAAAQAESDPNMPAPAVSLPPSSSSAAAAAGIGRGLALKTDISTQGSAKPITYRVLAGNSVFGIAKEYNIKPESILYSNEATLNDNPSNLTPGMELTIPPVDGLTYTWQDGDTLDKVANEFKADLNGDKKIDEKDAALFRDAIVNFPANNLDLTDPVVKPGQVIMIPGGHRELVSWLDFVPTTNRTGGTSATSELGGGACRGRGGRLATRHLAYRRATHDLRQQLHTEPLGHRHHGNPEHARPGLGRRRCRVCRLQSVRLWKRGPD